MSDKFKIICRDNFNRDNHSEWWIMQVEVSRATAEFIANALNDELGSDHSDFYAAVVPKDHKLYVWEP